VLTGTTWDENNLASFADPTDNLHSHCTRADPTDNFHSHCTCAECCSTRCLPSLGSSWFIHDNSSNSVALFWCTDLLKGTYTIRNIRQFCEDLIQTSGLHGAFVSHRDTLKGLCQSEAGSHDN